MSSETHNLRRPPHPLLSLNTTVLQRCPLSLHQTLFDTHHPPCSRSHRLRSSSPRWAQCSWRTTPTPVLPAPRPTRPRVPPPSWPSKFTSADPWPCFPQAITLHILHIPIPFPPTSENVTRAVAWPPPSSRLPFGHHPVDYTRSTSPLLSQGVRSRWPA